MSRAGINTPARQRGAVMIMTAAFLVAAIALLALAVDTGRLYAAQTRLQKTANLAALAAARQASGCRSDTALSGEKAAQAIIDDNYATGARPVVTVPSGMNAGAGYERGLVDTNPDTGLRRFTSDHDPAGEKPNAVRLTLVDDHFKPLFGFLGDAAELSASAGAVSRPEATFSLGTTLAEIQPQILKALLGVDVPLADVGTLTDTRVSLAQLLNIHAGLATHKQLTDITINQALANMSDAVSTLAPDLVNAIDDAVGDQPLSRVLSIAGPVGRSASLQVGSLVNSLAQLVAKHRGSAVDLPVGVDLGGASGLDGLTGRILLLEPARTVIGPAGKNPDADYYTTAYSAQVDVQLNLDLQVALGSLDDLVSIHLPLLIQVAQGQASLAHIQCPDLENRFYTARFVGQTAPVTAAIGRINADDSLDTDASARVSLLDKEIATLSNKRDADGTPQASRLISDTFDHRFRIGDVDGLPATYQPDNDLRLADLTELLSGLQLKVELLPNTVLGNILSGLTSGLLDTLITVVPNTLTSLLNPVLGPVLDPLFSALGIGLTHPTLTLADLDAEQTHLFCSSTVDCYMKSAAQ